MSYFRSNVIMDLLSLLSFLRAFSSNRQVAKSALVSRETAAKYRLWAGQHGLLIGPLPDLPELQKLHDRTISSFTPSQRVFVAAPFRDLILEWRAHNPPVEVSAIFQRLREHGYNHSLPALYRFIKTLEPDLPHQAIARVETQPGFEAQVDFTEAGKLIDPDTGVLRKAWAFVMVLSRCRHQYVEFVFDQKIATWLKLHRHAFEWFDGVPRQLKIDNLKAAIVKAVVEDPKVQRSYQECARHYGFLISPCRPATPQHKGKVESGAHYVIRNFLSGKPPMTLTEANLKVREWILGVAGTRNHGTTKKQPLALFNAVEKATLQPLPPSPFEPAEWKKVRLHRDCHVHFNNAYYSAPFRLIGQYLWVAGGLSAVRIFNQNHELVATHDSAPPGERRTHHDHYPRNLREGLRLNRESCLEQALAIGPSTFRLVSEILDDPILDRLPTAARILRLDKKYSASRLESACAKALEFNDPALGTVKGILQKGLDIPPPVTWILPPITAEFIRSLDELMGDESWI